jgi:hypothetical protein
LRFGQKPARSSLPRRFFGIVELNPDRTGLDMGQITADGVAEDVQRIINENCQTLHFNSYGFEES